MHPPAEFEAVAKQPALDCPGSVLNLSANGSGTREFWNLLLGAEWRREFTISLKHGTLAWGTWHSLM